MATQFISGILGIIVAATTLLNLSDTTLTWTLVIAGLAIAVSSFWGFFTEAK